MEFKSYIIEQLKKHPSTRPQDIVKQCYQAAFGAEHLLTNMDRAKQYLWNEYETVIPSDTIPLYEEISETICRVNLSAWKAKQLSLDLLFQLFVQSSSISSNATTLFLQYLEEIPSLLPTETISFEDWNKFLHTYKETGMPSLHHSEQYRTTELPSYRIIKTEWFLLLPILEKINQITTTKSQGIIAIDGRAGAGKTTLAKKLSSLLDAELIHMDDFFLPMNHIPFAYPCFDCSTMNYNKEKQIQNTGWCIVEGSYSHHPSFTRYADITIFVDIEKGLQKKRILQRNGEKMAQLFETKWIPMEETYFQEFQIKEKSDFVITQ